MLTKRPSVESTNELPFKPKFVIKEDDVALEKHEVVFVYWRDDDATTARRWKCHLKARRRPDAAKTTAAVYRYHWMFDGKPYFNDGKPYTEEFKFGVCYETFSLMCQVQFGIGVAI